MTCSRPSPSAARDSPRVLAADVAPLQLRPTQALGKHSESSRTSLLEMLQALAHPRCPGTALRRALSPPSRLAAEKPSPSPAPPVQAHLCLTRATLEL